MNPDYYLGSQHPRLIHYRQRLEHILQIIELEGNLTIKAMYNDTVSNIQMIMEDIITLNTTIYNSYFFEYVNNYAQDYTEDVYSRLTFDLTRNMRKFPR